MARFSTVILAAFVALGAVNANPVPTPDDIFNGVNFRRAGQAGSATWSYEGTGICGKVSSNTDLVVGVPGSFFDSYPGYTWENPKDNPICGKQIFAIYQGKSVTATVVDRNQGASEHMLNFSPAAFSKLAAIDRKTIPAVMWHVV